MKDRKNSSLLSRLEKFQRLFFVALLSVLAVGAFAQSKTVSGTVLDKTGESVIGASVVVKGTTNGTITDFDGKFTLQNVPDDGVIQISFVGYKTVDVWVKGQATIKVILEEDTETLDEVVVVGYGTMKKSDVTGALTRVTSAAIEERPVQNALQAMQGKAAGVEISTNSRPGELGDVRIRGTRSIDNSNDPLYVVDGIPLTAGSVGDLNPNDIESMEILKDASATAIYGSRGANGVVLVTTKKGTKGKASVSYSGNVTFSRMDAMTDWMNSGEYVDWQMQKLINSDNYPGKYGTAPDPDQISNIFDLGNTPEGKVNFDRAWQKDANGNYMMRAATAEEIAKGYAAQVPIYNPNAYETTDWTKLVTRTGITQNHQISISAGSENSNLYISLAYLDQQAALKDQDYKRYSANINGDITPLPWLTVGLGINASHSIQNYGIINNSSSSNTGAKDSYSYALSLLPIYPAYDENGNPIQGVGSNNGLEHNPAWDIDKAINETRATSVLLSSHLDIDFGKIWKPLEGLKWRTNLGAQTRNSRYGSYYGEEFSNPLENTAYAPNVAYNDQDTRLSWTLENMFFYNKTVKDIHNFGVTLMQSAEMYRAEGISYRAYDSTFPTALWYSLGNSDTTRNGIGSDYSKQTRASYMARLNYNLMDRYLLTVTGRWDGASVLAVGSKWDFFPSAALAWKISEEAFMKDITWINQIKLRAGYGVTGNASVSPYQTSGAMTASGAGKFFGEGGSTVISNGAKANVLPNYGLGWEKTASTNFGIDFGFLNNRISGSIEYYEARTSDLILSKAIPGITGYTSIRTNIGKTANRGFELTLSTINVKTNDFTWKTDFSFSTNKGWIVELANGKVDDTANGWFIDRPIDNVWNYKYDRLWQNNDNDLRLLALYNKNGIVMKPGMAMIEDQPLIEVPSGTAGAKTTEITWTDTNGQEHTETVTYEDNGFGTINDDDKKHLGQWSPKWSGGFTTTFTYKDWELSAFFYGRFGGTYFGLLQTLGRRVEKDLWGEDNPGGKYPIQYSGGTFAGVTDYSRYMSYTKGNMVALRNISLSYNLPKKWLNKVGATKCQVYAQCLNPFIWGGELVKAGINPDDMTGWTNFNSNGETTGGQTNNTMLTRSYVIGVRLGF